MSDDPQNNFSQDSTNGHSPGNLPGGHEKSWLDYLFIIREHLLLSMIVAACASAYYFHKQSQEIPMYRSSALVLFETQKDRVINLQEVHDTSLGRAGESILKNHLTDIRSNSFRQRVIESLSEEEKEIIRRGYASPENPEPGLHGIIAGANRTRQLSGNIFTFEFHHRNPTAASLLANRFTEEFNDFVFERARRSNDAAIRFLRSQSEELKLRVERAELAVQRYRQERNLVSLEESQNLIVARMKNLSGNLNAAKVNLLNFNAVIDRIEAAEGDLETLRQLPSINQRGEVREMINQQRSLETDRQNLSARYGENHPRMIANATAQRTVRATLDKLIKKAVNDIRQEYIDLEAQVDSLSTALAAAEQEALELDQIAIEYNVLRRKLDTEQGLFTRVHQRLNEALLASQLTDTNFRVVDRAWPASSPFTPDTAKTTTMTAFIFIVVTVSVPFALHFLNLKLKTPRDIETSLKISFIGEIRKLPRRLRKQSAIVQDKLDDFTTESFRQILSQLLLRNRNLAKGHTFVVTSALPKEGKSFFSLNMATTFSRHHYRTLLIDCDFRRPSVAVMLGNRITIPEIGAFETMASLDPIPVSKDLDVLPSFKSTSEATEWLESEEFSSRLTALKEHYDIIIIDTPPAGLFPDASLIGSQSDQFIFITQINKHRKAFLQGVVRRLHESGTPIIGTVVNKVSKRRVRQLGSYRYADYSRYKNYYPTKAKEPVA